MNHDAKYWTIQAMRRNGGSFVVALAELLERADPVNVAKIERTWPEYVKKYARIGQGMKDRPLMQGKTKDKEGSMTLDEIEEMLGC